MAAGAESSSSLRQPRRYRSVFSKVSKSFSVSPERLQQHTGELRHEESEPTSCSSDFPECLHYLYPRVLWFNSLGFKRNGPKLNWRALPPGVFDSGLHQAFESRVEMELMRESAEPAGVLGSELQEMFVLQTSNHHQESQIIPIMCPRRDQCEAWN